MTTTRRHNSLNYKFGSFLFIAFIICMASNIAYGETGGSCGAGGKPINFTHSCSFTITPDNKKSYVFMFQGTSKSADDTQAADPLVVTQATLIMGTNFAMKPVAG